MRLLCADWAAGAGFSPASTSCPPPPAREDGVFSPPPARAARGGEGAGVGGLAACSSVGSELVETPPTPDLESEPCSPRTPPLRGRRGAERTDAAGAFNSTSVGKNPASVLPAPVGAIN